MTRRTRHEVGHRWSRTRYNHPKISPEHIVLAPANQTEGYLKSSRSAMAVHIQKEDSQKRDEGGWNSFAPTTGSLPTESIDKTFPGYYLLSYSLFYLYRLNQILALQNI